MASKSVSPARSKQLTVAEAASRHAHHAFRDGFNQFISEATQLDPKGSLNRTVDAYLTAMRVQLEWSERAQVRS